MKNGDWLRRRSLSPFVRSRLNDFTNKRPCRETKHPNVWKELSKLSRPEPAEKSKASRIAFVDRPKKSLYGSKSSFIGIFPFFLPMKRSIHFCVPMISMRLTPDEFLSRWFEHIPPRGLRMIRRSGLYANSCAKKRVEIQRQLLASTTSHSATKCDKKSLAAVFPLEPERYPLCNTMVFCRDTTIILEPRTCSSEMQHLDESTPTGRNAHTGKSDKCNKSLQQNAGEPGSVFQCRNYRILLNSNVRP